VVGGFSLLLVLFQAGCYSYLPLQTELPRTPDVRVTLNDRGRQDVSEAMGPFVEWVEGAVAGEDSTTLRLRVARVVYARGGSSVWTGEEVTIPKSGVLGFQGRQFSKGRTWALAGVTAAVIAFSILSVNFDLIGNERDDRCTGPGCGDGQTIRW
jgi:hypothetical protein